jgi:hypothetical protein
MSSPETAQEFETHLQNCTSRKPFDFTATRWCFQLKFVDPRLLRVIHARKRETTRKEQQAAREQVLSPTLEIRSYQQVDRKLISSIGGCKLP